MTEERKYIYSIISAQGGSALGGKNPQAPLEIKRQEASTDAQGIGSLTGQETQAPDNFRLSESILGINNRDILFVPYRDIVAAVSNTHLVNFDTLDKKELTQFIAAHDQVNAGLMKKHDVIPMRFGMIAENTEAIRNILAKAYIQFKAALEKVAGKVEFIVQVFWNEKNVLEKLLRENIEIQELKKEAEAKGKILGFSSKIKLGKRIFEALELSRKEYRKDILDNLATHFPDFSAGKLLDKEMLMNYSFLIGMTEESALEFRLNQLAEKYSAQCGSASAGKDVLKFKYIGPMAPYSFAVINLGVGNFDLIDNARRVLGLGESAALVEIRDAYHKLAHEHHPDKQFFTKDQVFLEKTERKMKDIITANEVLTFYCKHYLSTFASKPSNTTSATFVNVPTLVGTDEADILGKKEQLCSFRKEDVEDQLL